MKKILPTALVLLILLVLVACTKKQAASTEGEALAPSTAPAPAANPATKNNSELGQFFALFSSAVPAPDFTVSEYGSDKVIKLSDYRGKIVLINFWATWCGPCRTEMPTLQSLWDTLKNKKDFALLGVNFAEDEITVDKFLRAEKFTYPIYMDEMGSASALYNVHALPASFLIGRDSTIIGSVIGALDFSDPKLVQLLTNLVDAQ